MLFRSIMKSYSVEKCGLSFDQFTQLDMSIAQLTCNELPSILIFFPYWKENNAFKVHLMIPLILLFRPNDCIMQVTFGLLNRISGFIWELQQTSRFPESAQYSWLSLPSQKSWNCRIPFLYLSLLWFA